MDFANIDLRTAAEVSTPVHLEFEGKRQYAQPDMSISDKFSDKPCRVMIRGAGSEKVSAIIREIERLEMLYNTRAGRTKDKDLPALVEQHQEALRDAMGRLIHAAVVGFENIIFLGKEVEAAPEYIDRLCAPRTAFFQQVYEAILERRNFLTSAAAD